MPNDLDNAIRTILDRTVVELSTAIRASLAKDIQAALAGASGGGGWSSGGKSAAAPASKVAKAPAKQAKASKGGRRSPEQSKADLDALLAYVKANPGKRSEEIQAGTKIAKPYVGSGLLALRQSKKVRMAGQKRSATYTAA